jgi:tetratricopeptide (TPR) repeat protein
MLNGKRYAKVNVNVLIILILITAAIVTSLFAARQIRRRVFSKMYLEEGKKAFDNKDWSAAYENFKEYLGRNPDDLGVLKKYAEARLSIRPLDGDIIAGAVSAYRRILQLDPLDETAYDKLAMLYTNIGNFEELAYIAQMKLENVPNDKKALLWRADALFNLNKVDEAQQVLLKLIPEDIEALSDNCPEYVQACLRMSNINTSKDSSPQAAAKALEWLDRAVDYAPESAEALVNRARFYCETSAISGLSRSDRLAAARKDLDAVDSFGTENPQILFLAGSLWLGMGELDKAAAEIQSVDNLSQETIEKYFFDVKGSMVARFLLACELAVRRDDIMQAVSLADEALKILTEERHRIQVLPSAVRIYTAAGKVTEARSCLDEYLDSQRKLGETQVSSLSSSYLQAMVAMAEGKPYLVIDILRPVVVNNASAAELWRLLAEAYSQTDQTRRSVSALIKYLSLYPRDGKMTLQLAQEYLKLQDWSRMFEAAQQAESLNPADITAKLLRIEADVHLAVEQSGSIDQTKLEKLSAELQELRQTQPDNVNIRTLQAVIAINLKQSDRAERELKLAIEECNEPLNAEMQLASYYYQAKRFTEAISLCKAACKRHPDVAESWLCLSELYAAQQDYDSSRSCLKQGLNSITAEKEKRLLSIRLALLELLNGDRTAGIDILTELAAQDEQEIQARLLLLGVREIKNDPIKAQKLIEELKQVEGQSGLWWRLHQGSLWLSSPQWRAKQRDITELLQYCISADPAWSAPVLVLMNMYEKLDDSQRIEDTARQALARNPSAANIADKLLLLLEQQGRFTDAENILRQVETNWKNTSAWQVRIALRTGDVSRAIDELKLRASNDDRDALSRIQLARLIYQQTRDPNQAFAYLNEAEAITSGSLAATGIKASILKAEGRAKEAMQVIDDYVTNHDNFNAYWMRALYLANEGEYERAETDYKKLTTFAEAGATGYGLLCNFYLSREKNDKAVATIEEGINKYPENLSLQRTLMKLLFPPGPVQDRPRAMEILASLEEKLPQDLEIMKFRAAQLLENPTPQSLKIAKGILENVIELEPTAIDAHLALIGIAMQAGEYSSARDYAIQALGTNPNNPSLLSARGRAELAIGNTQMAVELAHLVLRKDPNNTEARDVLVRAALNSGDDGLLKEARILIESAVNKNPADEKLLISRAHVLASMKIPRVAIPELEAYCQTEQGSKGVLTIVTLAGLYRLTGDMNRAKQRIEQAEDLAPNNQAVVHAKFLLLVAQKRFEELEQISSAYLSAKEQNPEILLEAATTLAGLDSTKLKKEGLKLFEQVVSLLPASVNARIGMASTTYQLGNTERAEKLYRELLTQYPNNAQVLNDLAWIIQEYSERYDEALELANKGLNLAPNELHLLDTRGTILSKMPNRLGDAAKDLEKLVELSSSDTRQKAWALLKLSRIYAKLGDMVSAKQRLENALEIDRKIDVFTLAERSEIGMILHGN